MPFYDVEDRPVTASIGVAPLEDLTVAAVVPPRNGEKNGRAVLSWPIVREMRASSLSGSELARKYGVSAVMACRIKRGEAWRE